jgi:hypothetical protein
MSSNQRKNIAFTIAAILLFLALADGWSYGFFTILRFATFTAAAYVAWLAYKEGKEGWTWFLGAIAVLFNPFVLISFEREVWMVIDFLVGVILSLSIFLLKLPESKR